MRAVVLLCVGVLPLLVEGRGRDCPATCDDEFLPAQLPSACMVTTCGDCCYKFGKCSADMDCECKKGYGDTDCTMYWTDWFKIWWVILLLVIGVFLVCVLPFII